MSAVNADSIQSIETNKVEKGIGGGMDFCVNKAQTEFVNIIHSDMWIAPDQDLELLKSSIVGEKHIKSVLIGPEGTNIKTIAFNAVDNELGAYLLRKNNKFNIAGKLSLNEWRGEKNVEFIIDDISVNKNIKN